MATVTKSIGTSSRDYSTITAWEADLDDTNIYTSGDDAVGECYDDSAFDESVTINGGSTVGLNSVKLTASSTERHDGTAGTGVRIIASASYTTQINCSRSSLTVEWLECDGDQITASSSYKRAIYSNADTVVKNVILHDIYSGRESFGFMTQGTSGGAKGTLLNSIIYNILSSGGTQPAIGIYIESGTGQTVTCYNNTVFNVSKSVNASAATGIASHSVTNLKNNIVVGTNGATTNKDFNNSGSNISYNLSSDSTASGTGSLTGKTAANQFVSTVSGSEDLHLKSGADAIGAGVDLATSSLDINGSDRNALAATVWDIGAHQFAITASIGSTGRDYSTITLWEADLDDTTIYGAGANAVGECYNDSTFTQTDNLIIRSGGAVGLNSVTLTAATTDRHDGTAGTGAEIGVAYLKRIYMQAGYNASVSIKNVVSWLDINGQGYPRTGLFAFYTANDELKNCICRSVGDAVLPASNSYNNIIYNGGAFIYGANYGTSSAANILNNTVYGVNRGITISFANSNVSIKNNICAGTSIVDFDGNYGDAGYGVPQVSNNLSSDATAPGTNSLINKSAAKQFVSTLSGSEDLHLKFTSAAIDAGVDLGTTPDGVQYDINGKDRDAENSIWDIGAHEFGDNVVYGLFTVL